MVNFYNLKYNLWIFIASIANMDMNVEPKIL